MPKAPSLQARCSCCSCRLKDWKRAGRETSRFISESTRKEANRLNSPSRLVSAEEGLLKVRTVRTCTPKSCIVTKSRDLGLNRSCRATLMLCRYLAEPNYLASATPSFVPALFSECQWRYGAMIRAALCFCQIAVLTTWRAWVFLRTRTHAASLLATACRAVSHTTFACLRESAGNFAARYQQWTSSTFPCSTFMRLSPERVTLLLNRFLQLLGSVIRFSRHLLP